MNRPILSIQERALRSLIRTGEVELKTVRYEAIDGNGNIVQREKQLYKTRDDCRYNLLSQPREEPRFRSCSCCTCKYKYVTIKPFSRTNDVIRMCDLHKRTVVNSDICEDYAMREYLKRL